jgi:hypothetical protein
MDSALLDETCEQFLGQWKRLVSTTNWDKGQIIHQWRQALIEAGAPAGESSDDAWSRRVGNVTPQHVGRLRRVFERFSESRDDYRGLFWSHFQAALDWDDAEMWLEGAVQNDWSISQMRSQRAETLGQVADEATPVEETGAAAPWDEDAEPTAAEQRVTGTIDDVQDPEARGEREEADDNDDSQDDYGDEDGGGDNEPRGSSSSEPAPEPVRPFASLPPLPPDVNDAFEAYKLCILRHKLAGWSEISQADLLTSLESLKQLALAPAEL